ncbi:MAG: apolipoprotein N-acyltransferase [Flavobacteriia bacterium]
MRYSFSMLSGLLMVLSFPYTGSMAFVMFFAWVPLLFVEHTISNHKYRSSKVFIHSYITFLIYNIGTTWWIWNASPGGAIFAFTLNALIMALIFQAFHLTKKYVGIREGTIALVIFWLGFEYLHYQWELSWPWLSLGNVFANYTYLIQWYSVTGVTGGSLWILAVNLILFQLLKNIYIKKLPWRKETKFISLFFVVSFLPAIISIIQYLTYQEKGLKTEIVITQPNVDPYNEKFTGSVIDQLNKICNLADIKVSPKTDFVLAPETALPFEFYEDEVQRSIYFHHLLERKAEWDGPSLFIGASTRKYFKERNSRASRKIYGGPGYEEFYNSSMLLDEIDKPTFVHKSKLVLGVEKVPFSNIFPYLEELSINNGGTSGTLGIEDESQVLKSKGITFAPAVCYESIYGEFIAEQCKKGAELIFIITNDGWWGDTPGYKQHMAFARLRAIENRKAVARSANTGTSCFINQRGDILQQSEWWTETSLSETVLRNSDKTFYARFGDYIGLSSGVAGIFLFLFTVYKMIRRKFSF